MLQIGSRWSVLDLLRCCWLLKNLIGTMFVLIMVAAMDLTSKLTGEGNYDTQTLGKMAKAMRNPTSEWSLIIGIGC